MFKFSLLISNRLTNAITVQLRMEKCFVLWRSARTTDNMRPLHTAAARSRSSPLVSHLAADPTNLPPPHTYHPCLCSFFLCPCLFLLFLFVLVLFFVFLLVLCPLFISVLVIYTLVIFFFFVCFVFFFRPSPLYSSYLLYILSAIFIIIIIIIAALIPVLVINLILIVFLLSFLSVLISSYFSSF